MIIYQHRIVFTYSKSYSILCLYIPSIIVRKFIFNYFLLSSLITRTSPFRVILCYNVWRSFSVEIDNLIITIQIKGINAATYDCLYSCYYITLLLLCHLLYEALRAYPTLAYTSESCSACLNCTCPCLYSTLPVCIVLITCIPSTMSIPLSTLLLSLPLLHRVLFLQRVDNKSLPTRPEKYFLYSISVCARIIKYAVCASCPQACMTPVF